AGIPYTVFEPQKRKPNVRSGGYADNFSTNRRTVWTH
ncbi:ETC complex I subunit, partial [Amylibacter sp.]|nr:ETC complex I subunit [Amylibacter sp.]